MKKVFIALFVLFNLVFPLKTDASSSKQSITDFNSSMELNNRYFGYFITHLYHEEIMAAIQDYYEPKGIQANGYGNIPNTQTVLISFGDYDKFSYALKITLAPIGENGKILGTDTLYFAAEPSHFCLDDLSQKEYPRVKLMQYEHNPEVKY
ncbi:hypothetical protein JOC85_003055 [Bacillus mesophilus]|uniref:DUF3888 domain-containing protein n=1 Tax=Bacillus mesophilus TaxID=1808955 RepID=A0A6M0Q9Y8_9BACI|nr:hypothetical protein [Bacillus mesophilus]MBM7662248.1 hypothetical protein [Bacillus mesophilus]NEY73113.1 hypothetical protein [Bacillus mesophilus]